MDSHARAAPLSPRFSRFAFFSFRDSTAHPCVHMPSQSNLGVKRALVLPDDDDDDDDCHADDESDDASIASSAIALSTIADDSAMCTDEPLPKRRRGLPHDTTHTHACTAAGLAHTRTQRTVQQYLPTRTLMTWKRARTTSTRHRRCWA